MKGSLLFRAAAPLLAVSGMLAIPAAYATPSASFTALPAYLNGSKGGPGPEETNTVAVDLNGDGKLDLIMCDGGFTAGGTGFYVMLGHGDGTFTTLPLTSVAFSVGALALGDFNRDGKVDLIAMNDYTAYVMLGNGDGTFTQGASYTVPQEQQDNAVVNDFNHDGKLDVAFYTHAGIYTLLGNGDGTFNSTGTLSPFPILGGSGLALAHLNNDGNADLVASDAITQQAYLFKGNGDGTFTFMTSVTTNTVPGTILAGDLNGDGIDDIVTSNEANSATTSVQVNLSNGYGGWGAAQTYAGGLGPVSGALADLNHDGKLDIISSATLSNQLYILLNNGDGTFGAPLIYNTATAPQTPVAADFNGDGKPDLAVGGVLIGSSSLGDTALNVLLNTTP